jgi:hypothetical protein
MALISPKMSANQIRRPRWRLRAVECQYNIDSGVERYSIDDQADQ